jgi:hypothetical protein
MADYTYSDGGRSQYFKGTADDCAARAMAIALQMDYREAYDKLAEANAKGRDGVRSARNGIYKDDFDKVLAAHGWTWVAAPKFKGRKAYVRDMPKGRVIARMARHFVAVIDGVAHDTWDSTHKMIYGYWEGPKDG